VFIRHYIQSVLLGHFVRKYEIPFSDETSNVAGPGHSRLGGYLGGASSASTHAFARCVDC
jgi:hypothetical protein